MGIAHVISMVAQPVRASYLCFEVGGILDTRPAQLGATVAEISYRKLTDLVRSAGTAAGDLSRLAGDGNGVAQVVKQFALATLRNEDRKAALDSAINTRQNVYFSKFANAPSVISTIRAFYSRTSPTSKPNRVEMLSDIAQQQAMDLQEAYTEDDRVGVVRATTSSLETSTRSSGDGFRTGKFYQESVGRNVARGTMLPHVPPYPWEGYPNAWQGYPSIRFKAPAGAMTAVTIGGSFEQSSNSGRASGTQSTTHVDYEYRTPYLEARARNNRAQISLMDQKFELYMFEQNIPHLEKIFNNELASIDNDVYQLQLALLRSFLFSPVPGIVTGVYKNPGEAVNAGEPVLRVEDNRVVDLVGSLVHQGPIALGSAATVTTRLSGAASAAATVPGNVAAARGAGGGGRWEVVIRVNNMDGGGNFILPLGYCFDAEFTSVTLA